MNFYSFCMMFFSVSTFSVGSYILMRRRDEIGKTFFVLTTFASGWAYHMSELFLGDSPNLVLLVSSRLGHFCSLFIPWAWITFIHSFLGLSRQFKMFRSVLLLASSMVGCLVWSTLFINRMIPKAGYASWVDPGILYHIFTVLFVSVVSFGFVQLSMAAYRARQNTSVFKHYFILLIANLIAFLSGGSTFGPVYYIPVPIWLTAPIIVYPFMMGYSITNHGLLDTGEFIVAAHRHKLMTLGMFSASVHHEIKNPMYVIKSSSEAFINNLKDGFYADRSPVEVIKEAINVCERNVSQIERATDIIERFARFVRPHTQTDTETIRAVQIQSTVETVLDFVHYAGLSKYVVVHRTFAPDLPVIRADNRELEEILFNLIVNAYNVLNGNGQIQVRGFQEGNRVKLTIEDNGPGISPEKLEQIFEPFYTTGDKSNGTGLGLYIAKMLAERNRGVLSVSSEPGRGTKFTLSFCVIT